MAEHYNIPIADIMGIQVQISNKTAFEALVKSFHYDEAKSLNDNLKDISQATADFLKLQGRARASLKDYLVEKNIPIEVTFKPLRADQLQNMIQQWLTLHTQSSTIIEKLYSNNHRNILFKRVLFEERETIDDYFKTLSEKSMLRGVDLYQLLVDILSPFFLYQFALDSETFFEKVNSLNSFLAVVSRFIHSQKRISVGINSQDAEYIRRFEFDRLIEFWEGQNQQLTLLSERRKNHHDKQTQTAEAHMNDHFTQTERSTLLLPEIINEALRGLNKLTCDNQSVQELQTIERIYSFLRKEKIALLQDHHDEQLEKTSQKTQKKTQNSPDFFTRNKTQAGVLVSLIDPVNDTIGSIEQESPHQVFSLAPTPKPHQASSQRSKISLQLKETLRSIYNVYFSPCFGQEQLEKCLDDIGVAQKDILAVVEDLMISKPKVERHHIYFQEFQRIISDLMVLDCDLTDKVLEDFLKAKLDELLKPTMSYSRRRSTLSSTYYRY